MTCAKVGAQNCNPDLNPGGAFCCLEEKTSTDAATDDVDAATDDVDAVTDAVAPSTDDVDAPSDASDANDVMTDADAARFCSVLPVPGQAPATLTDVPFDIWCASNPGALSERTCGGFVVITIAVGVDCREQYFFDAASKRLAAVLQACNVARGACVAGNPDFVPPEDCFDGHVPIQFVDVCLDGGWTTMAPDGARRLCANDSQCPTGYRCGYFTNSGCGAAGSCFFGDFVNNPTCQHEVRCACDGTETEGCVGPWGGFMLKPVPTRDVGPCTE
jgi:hypothetical protein